MLKLQDRDLKVLDFLKEYKCARTSTISSLYFPSIPTCERRLKKLMQYGKIKRYRHSVIDEYIWYIKAKPTNLQHTLCISRLYTLLQNQYQVIKIKPEYEIRYRNKVLRADLMAVIKIDNQIVPLIFEIDLSKPYTDKYTEYISKGYYKAKFPMQPMIIVISSRTPKSNLYINWHKPEVLQNTTK